MTPAYYVRIQSINPTINQTNKKALCHPLGRPWPPLPATLFTKARVSLTVLKGLQLHHVGGMQSNTGLRCRDVGLPVFRYTAVDLTWLLVCVRCEAAVCYIAVPDEFDSPQQENFLLVVSLLDFVYYNMLYFTWDFSSPI